MGVDRSVLGLIIESKTVGEKEIDRLASSFNRFADGVEKQQQRIQKSNDSAGQSLSKLKTTLTDPLGSAGSAAESFVTKYGKVGIAAAGVGIAVTAASAAIFKLVQEQGKAAEQAQNFADRLGIGVGQSERLAAQARIAGVDIGALEASSRILAEALEDQSGGGSKAVIALQRLGVSTRTLGGEQRDLGQVTLEVIERLARIEDTTKRVALASAILGRGAKEIQPLIKAYLETEAAVRKLGVGLDENATKRLIEVDDEIDKLQISFAELRKSIAAEFAPITISIIQKVTRIIQETTTPTGPKSAFQRMAEAEVGLTKPASDPRLEQMAAEMRRQVDAATSAFIRQSVPLASEDLRRGIEQARQFTKQFESNDDFIRQKLEKLRKDAQNLRNDLLSLDVGKQAKDAKAILLGQNEKEIAQLEQQLKLAESRRNIEQEILRAHEERLQKEPFFKAGISPEQLLPTERRAIEFAARPGVTPQQTARFRAELEPEKLFELNRLAEEGTRRFTELNQAIFKQESTDFFRSVAIGLETAIRLEERRFQLVQERMNAEFSIRRQLVDREIADQARLIEARARPGEEIGAAIRASQIRAQGAIEAFKIEQERIAKNLEFIPIREQAAVRDIELLKARGELEQAQREAEIDGVIRIAELRKRDIEQSREAAGRVFDAIKAGGGNAFKDLVGGLMTTFQRQVFVNLTSELFERTRKQLGGAIPGQVDDKGKLTTTGRLLQGTFLGIDPLKLATQANTLATQFNTAATTKLSAALIGQAGALAGGSTQAGVGGLLERILGFDPTSARTPPFVKQFSAQGEDWAGSLERMTSQTDDFAGSLRTISEGSARSVQQATLATQQGAKLSTAGKVIGGGGAIVGGVLGVVEGVKQGGARGAATATSAAAGTASTLLMLAGVTGPAAPILAGVALALSLVTALFGDPKKERQEDIERDIENRKFEERRGRDLVIDRAGRELDTDIAGGTRIIVQVSTMDARSFIDNSDRIAEATRIAFQNGHPLVDEVRSAVIPQ